MKKKNTLIIKNAEPKDADVLLKFIHKLAEYEKLLDDISITVPDIEKTFFCEHPKVFALLGYFNNEPVGYAIYFYNYSSFKGKHGLYLEDLFILPEYRSRGFGKQMLIHLARICKENDCGRFEWSVLNWNEPAINFYKSIGAIPLSEWTVYRLDEKNILKLADSNF